jgi:hypothetical protein
METSLSQQIAAAIKADRQRIASAGGIARAKAMTARARRQSAIKASKAAAKARTAKAKARKALNGKRGD